MQQRITQYRMKALCEALSVSRSGYLAWLYRPVNRYKLACKDAINTSYLSHKAVLVRLALRLRFKQKVSVSVRAP